MRKVFVGILMVMMVSASAWGVPIPLSGSMTSGNGIYATPDWTGTTLTWEIHQLPGLWSYSYVFTVPDASHDISHIILQLSNNFTKDDINSLLYSNGEAIDDKDYDIDDFSFSQSNPGLPDTLYGLKIDLDDSAPSFAFTLLTERAPMLGNFYAKDGGTDCYAYTGTEDGFGYNLPVPDTNVVPEPGTFMLLGLGLVGIAAYRKRKI